MSANGKESFCSEASEAVFGITQPAPVAEAQRPKTASTRHQQACQSPEELVKKDKLPLAPIYEQIPQKEILERENQEQQGETQQLEEQAAGGIGTHFGKGTTAADTSKVEPKKESASGQGKAQVQGKRTVLSLLMDLCKCLFGSGPSSSSSDGTADSRDPEDPKRGHSKRADATFEHGKEKQRERVVLANDREFNAQFGYADNFIKTSKYTIATFVPINLYQQFTRIANSYFLVLLFLQCIPQIASVSWVYTFVPLSFVLLCSAIKDGYDDLQRHRNDRQVNNRISYVVRNSRLQDERWMSVKVGDIIRMENEHFIAADLLLLSSSESHGICYIETAELDGETNLKTRSALPETVHLGDKLALISAFDGKIMCEPPNNRLDHFEGRLDWRGKAIPLDNKNMLLRGCRLKNTRWCYGLVVFAGKDTKLMRNSGESPMKRTSLDRFLNILIIGIVLFLLACCLICTVMSGFWEHVTGRYFRIFLPWDPIVFTAKNLTSVRLITDFASSGSGTGESAAEEAKKIAPSQVLFISALQFFSYIILLNTVVPISLYISVEMIRLAHSKFINCDRKMYDEKTDTPAKARTSTLNEELGQVQYVFSDKTGTLTQNIMVFKKCSINGRSYGDLLTERGELVEIDEQTTPSLDFSGNRWYEPHFRFYDHTLLEDTKKGHKEVHEFWRLLSICHTVMPERKPGNVLEYQAQSPDEAALTASARNFGFVFKSRTPQSVTVEVNGREEVYEMLHILDFDNVRKRMSVLVRSRSGEIKLYCKGADSLVLERVSQRETSELLRSATLQHLDKFATDGLRTLCVAYKHVKADYCKEWMAKLQEARLDQANKDERVNALYEEMEKDMLLLGATAIEDKLQDGVPQTIATLAAANIKLWVLTGDKTETAINIGYSCKLLTEDMREVFIIDGKEEKEVEVQLKDIRRRIASAKGTQKMVGISSFYVPPRTPIGALSPNFDSPRSPLPMGPKVPTIETTFPVSVNDSISAGTEALGPKGTTEFLARESERHFDESGLMPRADEEDQFSDEYLAQGDGGYALVINGDSLAHALKRKYEKTFLQIGCDCVSVICCRVTPLQKAQVVDLVKRNVNKAVTLAIGDGANDVSMIRTAHIGVGISGQEGMQAVLSSDFSIGQFRFLERLLLVHGRWSYLRMCKFLRYFFYKNFAYTLTHFWYSFFCGFSALTVYDPVLISLYNLFFTALPVLAMGIFDQDVCDDYSIRFPQLYIPGQFDLFFNMRIFTYSIIHGMFSSLVLFFVPFGTFFHAIDSNGRDMNDYAMLAFTAFTALVLVVTGQIAFDTAYWTWINWFVVLGSLFLYILVVVVLYQFVPISWYYPYIQSVNAGVVERAIKMPDFWLSLLLICAILLLPVFASRFFWFDTHPSYADRLRVVRKLFKDEGLGQKPETKQMQPTTSLKRRSCKRRSLRSGYAFSHSAGFGELIAKGTLFKNIKEMRVPPTTYGLLAPEQHDQKQRGTGRRISHLFKRADFEQPKVGIDTLLKPSLLLTPATLTASEEGNGTISNSISAQSVTQFSPGSSNIITTTKISTAKGSRGEQERRTTVDSLVLEYLPEFTGSDMDTEEMLGPSISRITMEEGEEMELGEGAEVSGRVMAQSAVIVPLRGTSPDLRNTAHNLVVNVDLDEETPLPSNWRYNPDGTLYIPELENPPQPGTCNPAGPSHSHSHAQQSSEARKIFVSKKRREIESAARSSPFPTASESSNGNEGGRPRKSQPQIYPMESVSRPMGVKIVAEDPSYYSSVGNREKFRDQPKRVFTGKKIGGAQNDPKKMGNKSKGGKVKTTFGVQSQESREADQQRRTGTDHQRRQREGNGNDRVTDL